jgi:hypothetical protein
MPAEKNEHTKTKKQFHSSQTKTAAVIFSAFFNHFSHQYAI